MYPHHQTSIQALVEYFQSDSGVTAVILGGSVAKDLARPDSDVDAMVIVTPERLKELRSAGKFSECITGYCTYPEGYFDLKYYDREFLEAAALKGSEPARNAFLCARCLYSHDPEIPEIVARIPVFQRQEKADKMLSFYAALMLNMGYFWRMSDEHLFLRCRAVQDTVFFGLRLLLEDREVLFPCPKSLYIAISRLADKPAGILELADELLRAPGDAVVKDRFVDTVLEALEWRPPEDYSLALSRYVEDNELWWYQARPLIAEW